MKMPATWTAAKRMEAVQILGRLHHRPTPGCNAMMESF
jgi:hypothetical protein